MTDETRRDARSIIVESLKQHGDEHYGGYYVGALDDADPILDALYAGFTLAGPGEIVVSRDDLEMAVEWMDQSENPWTGDTPDTAAAAFVAHYALKDALAESYAAARTPAPEGEEGES